MVAEIVSVPRSCPFCGTKSEVEMSRDQYNRWQAGEMIQNVCPKMDRSQREILITGLCIPCQDDIFA